jgi:dolichyl-phosphate beta-glucosyltransferase
MNACIVVPCFNEEKRINTEKFLKFLNENDDINFLFVDDGSTDNTVLVLQHMQRYHPRSFYKILPANVGKAKAVRSGMLEAGLMGFTHVGYLDADLTISLSTAKNLLTTLIEKKVEFIFASRTKRFQTTESKNLPRQTIGYIFSFISKRLLQLPIADTQCGAKFFTAAMIPVLFGNVFLSKWIFDVEVFFRFKSYFYQNPTAYFHEFPIENWEDNEDSKVKILDYLKVPINLVKIFVHYRIMKQSLSIPYEFNEAPSIE